MSGNSILDNIDKKEVSALSKLIEVLKNQQQGNNRTLALLNAAEKDLGFDKKSKIADGSSAHATLSGVG
jgi:hypothetical protein